MSLLSLRLNEVDTSLPLLAEDTYILQIEAAELVPSKDNPSLLNLKVQFVTTSEATDDKGKTINPGYKLTRFYPIPSELRDQDKNDMFLRGLTLLALAVCDLKNTESDKAKLPEFDEAFIAEMAGKQVKAKVKTSKTKEGDEYGPKSEVSSVFGVSA